MDELALLKSSLPALLHFEGIPEKWLAVGALDPLQVYNNAGTPGGVFCSPLAPPPSRLTAMLDPGEAFLRFTSADLPFHNGWARLTWEGPSSLLVSEELTLVAAPPSPCLLICNGPSTGPRIDPCPSQATVGKMAELIWTEPALNDLDVIADHIALHDLQAAGSLVQRVFQHVGQLVEHPESGSRPAELRGRRYRRIVEPPCRVLYRYDGEHVFILYVMREEMRFRTGRLRNRDRKHRLAGISTTKLQRQRFQSLLSVW